MQFQSNDQRKPEMVEYLSDGLLIKKRTDYRSNEVEKVDKDTFNVVPSYGDRFIARRYHMQGYSRNKHLCVKKEVITDILNWDLPKNYWLQRCITDAIDKCFDLKRSRVLEFADAAVQYSDKNGNILHARQTRNKLRSDTDKDWACHPRRKPFAYSETTHDSVGFTNCFERNMMDWSVNGQVVASFENDVIIWKHIRDISITFDVESASCLAYCPKGKYLALGCKINGNPAIELWDVNKYSIKVEVVQRVFFQNSAFQVECFDWSKCGRFLVCGTSKGILYVLTVPKLKRVRIIQAHNASVSIMRFSPTMRFLASADVAGNILIYDWFSFNVYLYVRYQRRTDIVLDWHPWNGEELAIAEQMPVAIALLHVPSKQITAFYRKKDSSVRIHSLTFNKITAELLLSISRENSNGIVELKVLVLASLNRIVDVLNIENGARFLMWDPNGTRVATAGADDSLTIWNFHPKKEGKNKHKTIHDLSIALKNEHCDYGTQFRLWSTIK